MPIVLLLLGNVAQAETKLSLAGCGVLGGDALQPHGQPRAGGALEEQLERLLDPRVPHLAAVPVKVILRFGGDKASELLVDELRSLQAQQSRRGKIGFQHLPVLAQRQQGAGREIVEIR